MSLQNRGYLKGALGYHFSLIKPIKGNAQTLMPDDFCPTVLNTERVSLLDEICVSNILAWLFAEAKSGKRS